MYHDSRNLWKNLLQAGLEEDGCPWDWTTLGTRQNGNQIIRAKVIAKSEGIWAGEGLVECLNVLFPTVHSKTQLKNGDSFVVGQRLVEFKGIASEILALERPFLNLAAYVSGIATITSRCVQQVKLACPKRTPRVTLTRKTLPGYRDLAIHGVIAGGGHPHRVSLSGGVLIKENHIAAAGGIAQAIEGARRVAPHGLKIEIEVRSEKELKKAIRAQADGVLLDNFTSEEVRSALQILEKSTPRLFVEVSGGINEGNIVSYAIPGVDILSLGALTHTVKSTDLSLLVDHVT
jgi:nicotinate-nucleotide pyrophosphorylase (carboxylating)